MSKKAKILLFTSGLFTLAIGLSNVFVTLFLWKKSQDFVVIAQYNLMHYIASPVAYMIGGIITKRKNGTWPLRIGIGLFTLFFIFILLLKNSVVQHLHFLGLLFGLASGFYWLAFYVLSFDFTGTHNRDTFNGFHGSIASIANAIAPFTASYIIYRTPNSLGYTIVFALSLTLFVILILVSFLLKSEHYGKRLDYKKIFSKNHPNWCHLKHAITFWGLRDMVILFLISILIYSNTGSEFAVGKLTLLAYILSAIAYVTEQKYIKPKKRWLSLHLGATLMFIAVFSFLIKINLTTLLIYIIIDALFMPFFFVPMTSAGFNIIEQSKEKGLRTEYIINRELAINTGRIASSLILISLLTLFDSSYVLNGFLAFIGCSQFISLYFLRKIDIWEQ